jgi:hypothetical protein
VAEAEDGKQLNITPSCAEAREQLLHLGITDGTLNILSEGNVCIGSSTL